MMDTPKIYVACLASYNSGIMHGHWLDAARNAEELIADIQKMLAESPLKRAEEWAIHDYEGFGEAILSEYEDIENVTRIAAFMIKHGDLGGALLCHYTVEEAETLLEDHYHGAYDNEVDFAYSLFYECYDNAIPEKLMYYFDYVAFTRDLFTSDYFSVELNNKIHVFSAY